MTDKQFLLLAGLILLTSFALSYSLVQQNKTLTGNGYTCEVTE